jgi:hypothetical protein
VDIHEQLDVVRRQRSERFLIEGRTRHCIFEAEALLKVEAPHWKDEDILALAIWSHPAREWDEKYSPKEGMRILEPRDLQFTSGWAFAALEQWGGRPPKNFALKFWRGWHRTDARVRFAIMCACLVVFEGQMLFEAYDQKKELVEVWRCYYWLERFYGGMVRVRDDALMRRRSGRRNSKGASDRGSETRKKVARAFAGLSPAAQGRGAAGIIARRINVSVQTVRRHLAVIKASNRSPS